MKTKTIIKAALAAVKQLQDQLSPIGCPHKNHVEYERALEAQLAAANDRIAELENGIRNGLATLEEAGELNMGNYDEEQVAALNVSATNAWKILTEALSPKQEGGGDGG